MYKKIIAQFTLVAFLWASIITPANAFLPAVAAWFATLTTAEQVSLGASIALHAAIAAIKFTSDSSTPASDGSNVALQVQIDPNTPLVAPASSTPATIPATSGTGTVYNITYTDNCSVSHTTPWTTQAAVHQTLISVYPQYSSCPSGSAMWRADLKSSTAGPGYTDINVDIMYNQSNTLHHNENRHMVYGQQQGTVYTCPANYTLSGTNCVPTSAAQASDNKKSIARSGNTFVPDANDPDTLPNNVTVTSNKVKVDNGTKHDEVVIETNGTVSYYHWEGQTDGTTKQQKVTVSAPSGGGSGTTQVTAVDNSSFSGSGDNIGGSSGSGTVSSNVNVTGGSITAQLDKTGLATDGKQCGYDAAHPCRVDMDTSGLGTNAVSQDDYSTKAAAHQAKLEEVGAGGDHGWTWDWNPLSTISTGACSDPTFVIGGKTYMDLTGFCDKVAYVRGFFEFMLYIGTGIALFNILTGRREET